MSAVMMLATAVAAASPVIIISELQFNGWACNKTTGACYKARHACPFATCFELESECAQVCKKAHPAPPPRPAVMCDPNAKPPEHCPGGAPCPRCGKASCPCPHHKLQAAAGSANSSFVSNDGLYCAEGAPRATEAAIAMKKAAPIGSLFNATFVTPGKSCASLGYLVATGVDSCTPAVGVFWRSAADQPRFGRSAAAALAAFAQRYGVARSIMPMMAACTCAPGSPALLAAGTQCAALDHVTGCWVHRDPYPFGSHPTSLVPSRDLVSAFSCGAGSATDLYLLQGVFRCATRDLSFWRHAPSA
jgi:hypothetical protein